MPLPPIITFEILWYAGAGANPDAPNRIIGRDTVRRRDLTDAITAACNMLKSGRGDHSGYAHGFYVRSKRDRG